MRTVKWNAFLSGLCSLAVVLGVVAASAHADVTIEKGSSILVFPKVRADGTFDTVIQITNTGNSMVHARCFYVNAALHSILTGFKCNVPGPTCVPICQETDFNIWLTKQQPTHWVVSTGRRDDPTDGFEKDGSGFDPGRVPPVTDFEGELKCIEVSESEEPVTGNHLKGEATLKVVRADAGTGLLNDPGVTLGDVSKYNGVGIQGNPDVQPGNPLLLDGNIYNACPAKVIVTHFATGAEDKVAQSLPEATSSSTSTELTLVPCSEDLENQVPTSTTVQFLVFNELEQRFSASTTVTCSLSTELTQIDSPTAATRSVFSEAVLGTAGAMTEITPVAKANGTIPAVIGVAERITTVGFAAGKQWARSAYNLDTEGDLIPDSAPPDSVFLSSH